MQEKENKGEHAFKDKDRVRRETPGDREGELACQ